MGYQVEAESVRPNTDETRLGMDALRSRVAELEAEVERLRAAAGMHAPTARADDSHLRTDGPSPSGRYALRYFGLLVDEAARASGDLLTVTLSYTELALGELDAASPVREWVSEIRDAAIRNEALTACLAAAARKQPIDRVLLTPKQLMRESESRLRERLGPGQTLLVEYRTNCMVDVDPKLLDVALELLVDNAADALAGPGQIRVVTHDVMQDAQRTRLPPTVPPGCHVGFRVEDTGPGIPVELRKRVLEPFFTTRNPSQHSGLGLPTCEAIARIHGGALQVLDSERGAAVEIVFPCAGSETDASCDIAGDESSRIPTVLLVEDEFPVRQLSRRILVDAGYAVLVASSADEAMALALQNPGRIDLLLTDVVMPQVSGPELAARLRREFPRIGVLYVSGFTRDDFEAKAACSEEFLDLLPKPFHPDELVARVHAAIQRTKRIGDTIRPPCR